MPARTNPSNVRKVLEMDPTDSSDLSTSIETANAVVTNLCTDVRYTTAQLELIERWLAAHFWTITDGGMIVEEQAATLRQKNAFKVDLGLSVTHYGQQAMLVDPYLSLARYNNQIQKARLTPGFVFYDRRRAWTPDPPGDNCG